MDEISSLKKGHKKIGLLHLFIFLLILSLALNIFLYLTINDIKMNGNYISGEFLRLVRPLETEPADSSTSYILQYQNLRKIIQDEIEQYGPAKDVSFFLQDTQTGAWLGINERENFYPASLLKIPIMMAVLKKIEKGEMSLNDIITLIPEDLDSQWGNLYEKGTGTNLTVSELLEEMIASSDNTAKNALRRQLTLTEINEVFVHVGIPDPYIKTNNHTVSPRDYIRLFKSLYYSTFLSPHYSEMALELATDGKEENLISKGVPNEVQVSHKFGMVEEKKVLHDCGVVYYQKNPYFLCIMTNGIDITKSEELIPKLSKEVYDYIDKESNKNS